MLNKLSVGSDVLAACGRCKQNTWHVVFAMDHGRVEKVQCKMCQSYHRYKPVDEPRAPREAGKALVRRRGEDEVEIRSGPNRPKPPTPPRPIDVAEDAPARAPRKASARAAEEKPDPEVAWRELMASRDLENARTYAPSMDARAGEVIRHPTFGLGLVESLQDDQKKMNVHFSFGVKLLICRMALRQ